MDARRAVRRDLGAISAGLARQILSQTEPAIDAEVRRLRPALRHCQGLDEDDLRALGQIAALESYLTWQPDAGCALRSWAGRTIRWRLAEAIERSQSPERTAGRTPPAALEEAVDPSEDYDESERLDWLQGSLGGLTPRLRTLVAAKLRGESGREVGRSLGISDARVVEQLADAVSELREAAMDAGLADG